MGQGVLKSSKWRIYIRFVKTKKMSPPGIDLAYIYAKSMPGGDIFLVFTKRIYIRHLELFSTPRRATAGLESLFFQWFS